MNEVVIIAGMALVTFGIRYPLMALVSKITLPQIVLRALKYVPPAVLTAIIVPAVLFRGENDQMFVNYKNDYLIAGIVCVLVAWRSKNLLLTIVIGMVVVLGWRWLLSTHILG